MSPDDFLQFANVLPEAMLLVSANGTILAANRGAGRRLDIPPDDLRGRPLSEFTADGPERLAEYLRSCSRTGEVLLGSLTLLRRDGESLRCRAEGAALRPRQDDAPAVLLLRLVPRTESPGQFAILTQRIDDLTREIARRSRVEEELRAHREWLRVTLASIGDAVIATDKEGCITFMNSVAQVLTGWHVEEARGASLDQVFRIINEQTRIPVDHPVTQVLREGHIVGLANHSILIARDGTEYPIDDSAAPIQEDGGELLGVVLVFREVTERRRLESELRERAEALAAAARRRDDFLAMLAHELRNPLAPIRNAVHLLQRIGPPEPRMVRAREMIDRQVTYQARLIDDLLEVSRVTQGKIVLRAEVLDLVGVVRQTAEDSRAAIEAAGLTFSAQLPEAPMWVEGDVTRLHQVLTNVLNNAVRFTDPGGSVTVRIAAEPERQRAVVTVRDSGLGIDPEILPHIFEPFTQADRSLERSRGGLGLGLALVKGLVELHGGAVRAESCGLGCGAEFTLAFPLASAPVIAAELPVAAATAAPIRVLVIEDNRDTADSLRELLEIAGCAAEVAYSGPEGVEAAQRFRPQVVICDLGLPGMDGYQVARVLRQDPATTRARLIAVSGYGEPEHERRSEAAGFDAHLTKPVDFDDIERFLDVPPRAGG